MYAVFAFGLIVMCLFVPYFPIAQKLGDAKRAAIREIDSQLHDVLRRKIGEMREHGGLIDLADFESMLNLREKVERIEIWPFKRKLFIALLQIAFFLGVASCTAVLFWSTSQCNCLEDLSKCPGRWLFAGQ